MELKDWNTLQVAAEWLSAKTKRKVEPRDLICQCLDGVFPIMVIPECWGSHGDGEILWFDESGKACPGNFVSNGWIPINSAMCNELLERGKTQLRKATCKSVLFAEDGSMTEGVFKAGGHDLPWVMQGDLMVSRKALEARLKPMKPKNRKT